MPEANDIHTQMRCAAKDGNLEKVNSLLKDGANVNSVNFHKNTALHMAVFSGHKDVAQILINKGAELDRPNANGQTPLQLACCKGQLEIVKMITRKGCNLHAQTDYSEMTALHYASNEGQAEICQHLLDVGAEEEVLDAVEKIAEFYAANYPTELVFKKYKEKKGGKKPTQKKPLSNKQTTAKPEPQVNNTPKSRSTESQNKDKPVESSKGQAKNPSPEKQTTPGTNSKTTSTGNQPSNENQPNPANPEVPSDMADKTTATKQGESVPSDAAGVPAMLPATAGKSPDSGSGTGSKPNEEAIKPDETHSVSGTGAKAKQGAIKPDEIHSGSGTGTKAKAKQGDLQPEGKTTAGNESPTMRRREKQTVSKDGKKIPTYDTAKYNPEGHGFGNHTAGGGVEIPKYEKENYDKERQKQELSDAANRGKITLLKDHSFHWSEEHQSRMKQSVFDRLQGGGRSKKKPQEQQSQEKSKQTQKKGTQAPGKSTQQN